MPNTAATSPGTVANDASFGVTAWSNPSNAVSSNDSYATVAATTSSQYLKATNFGFAIPAGSTIDGIKVEVEKHRTGSPHSFDLRARIVKADGSIGATDKANASAWTTSTNVYTTYGGATDKWGETWTPADINDVDFGFALSCQQDTASTGNVDHIRITIYYTLGSTSYTITAVQGSYSYTGQVSLFHWGRKLIAAFGSYTFTGFAALLAKGKTLVVSAGTFTYTGYGATITSVRTMVAALGSYVLTGQNALFSVGHTIVASVGSFTYTGINALFSIGKRLIATYGSFTLTGYSITSSVAYLLTAASGLVSVSLQNIRLLLNGLLAIYSNKYTARGNSYDDKYTPRNTNYSDKYTHLN